MLCGLSLRIRPYSLRTENLRSYSESPSSDGGLGGKVLVIRCDYAGRAGSKTERQRSLEEGTGLGLPETRPARRTTRQE